jgi:glycine cleavage system aminomethyltransferase T
VAWRCAARHRHDGYKVVGSGKDIGVVTSGLRAFLKKNIALATCPRAVAVGGTVSIEIAGSRRGPHRSTPFTSVKSLTLAFRATGN